MAAPIISGVNRWDEFYDDNDVIAPGTAGDWQAARPSTNTQDRRLHRVARSADATGGSTQLRVRKWLDPGTNTVLENATVQAVLVDLPNATLAAQCRVRLREADNPGVDADTTSVASSGYTDVYPDLYPSGETILGEDPMGTVTAEQYAEGKRWPWVFVFDQAYDVAIIVVEILDEANPDGYVDVARVWAGPIYQSSLAVMLGERAEWDPGVRDVSTETPGGAAAYDRREQRPRWSFDLGYMDRDEYLVQVQELFRVVGHAGQLLFVPDEDDPLGVRERGGLHTMMGNGPATSPASYLYSQRFELVREV